MNFQKGGQKEVSNCKTISVCNQKGGVGKTTTTVNLGVGLAMQGKKVLLIDADPQGDLTTCLGWQDTDGLGITLATKLTDVINETMTDPMVGILHHEEGVDLVPANLELSAMEFNLVNAMSRETTLKNYLSQVKNRYDYVIIDCMPSLGMVTLNALSAADSVIIPVQAQYLPAKGMTQLVQTISKVKKYINPDIKIDGMLLTLVDSRTNLAKSTVEALRANFGNQIRMYRTQIPITRPEQELFMDYLKNSNTAVYWYPVFAVMLGTGLRVGEVTGLRWCDIDLEDGIIDVNHTLVYYDHRTSEGKKGCYFNVNTPKTEAGNRQVPMLDFVKEAFVMEKQRQELLGVHCEATIDGYTDFIFLNRFGQPQHQSTLNKAIRRIIRDCNDEQFLKTENPEVLLPHFSCHSLRHTFTTRMCEAGVNIKVIQDTLGHKDITTTLNIYTDVTKELKRTEFDGLDKYFNNSIA